MIETTLERIAVALEKIASGQGMSPATATASTGKAATEKLPGSTPSKALVVKPATKPATKPAQKALPAPEPEAEAEGEATEITLAVIGEDISALLQANQKPAAVELLAKFGAKSASGVPEDKYEEFHAEAATLLELAS